MFLHTSVKLEFAHLTNVVKERRRSGQTPKFVLIHLLKIVTTASRKLAHSLELDDLAL